MTVYGRPVGGAGRGGGAGSCAGRAAVRSPPDTADGATLAELELRNLLRVFAGWRRLEERSGSPARACSSGRPASRASASRRIARGGQAARPARAAAPRVVLPGLPIRRSDGAPLPALPRLLAVADEARLDPAALDALMTNPRASEGPVPAELLRRGRRARCSPSSGPPPPRAPERCHGRTRSPSRRGGARRACPRCPARRCPSGASTGRTTRWRPVATRRGSTASTRPPASTPSPTATCSTAWPASRRSTAISA